MANVDEQSEIACGGKHHSFAAHSCSSEPCCEIGYSAASSRPSVRSSGPPSARVSFQAAFDNIAPMLFTRSGVRRATGPDSQHADQLGIRAEHRHRQRANMRICAGEDGRIDRFRTGAWRPRLTFAEHFGDRALVHRPCLTGDNMKPKAMGAVDAIEPISRDKSLAPVCASARGRWPLASACRPEWPACR